MDASLTPFLWIISVLLVLAGLAGTVLPLLPGVSFVFLGLWLGAWIDGYAEVSGWTVVLLGLLTALAMALDYIAGALGAKKAGASKQAVTGALLGSLVGIFFGLPGLILGPFVGAVVGELSAQRDLDQAAAVGAATWVGLLLGTIAKLALSLTMLGVFLLAYLI